MFFSHIVNELLPTINSAPLWNYVHIVINTQNQYYTAKPYPSYHERCFLMNYYSKGVSTVWKVSKYRVISGPYFPVFKLNTEIYGDGPEITPYLGTFNAV